MNFTEEQIAALAPKPAAFKAGKKLSAAGKWDFAAKTENVMWGAIRGSGAKPYLTQIDILDLAYKCSCPSRQFPCKHALGLLLLAANDEAAIKPDEEPEWVKDWIDKRRAKAAKPKVEKEYSEEEKEKLEKGKEKRLEDRIALVNAGVGELELWLQDLVRLGLINLNNSRRAEIQNVAARMVDAKAPGLAGWVKALAKINFVQPEQWQEEAMSIIGKLNLLIQTWKNYPNLSPIWQQTIKNLVGWNQSAKELELDSQAKTQKDHWLVIGQEQEQSEDLIILRTWLQGLASGQSALLLNFGTAFSPLINKTLPGAILESELAFFPSVLRQRAIIRQQKSNTANLQEVCNANCIEIGFLPNLEALMDRQLALLQINPWLNNQSYLLGNVQLVKHQNKWFILDEAKRLLPLVVDFDEEKCMKWLLTSSNKNVDVTLVMRMGKALPLGIFFNHKYILL